MPVPSLLPVAALLTVPLLLPTIPALLPAILSRRWARRTTVHVRRRALRVREAAITSSIPALLVVRLGRCTISSSSSSTAVVLLLLLLLVVIATMPVMLSLREAHATAIVITRAVLVMLPNRVPAAGVLLMTSWLITLVIIAPAATIVA